MSHTNDPFPQSPIGFAKKDANNIAALIARMNQPMGYQSGDYFGPKVRVEGVPPIDRSASEPLDPYGKPIPPYRQDVRRRP